MYEKVSPKLDFVDREKEIVEFWKENQIFEKSMTQNEGGDEFAFYDGPPTANGKPHIGHILTRVMKDIIPRYKTMRGCHVLRKAGWDTHGLPVELEVEKILGMDGKKDIEKYGVKPFIAKCKESVWKYKGEWERMSERVGYWADMDNPYITYDDKYIESVWWSIKTIADQGLLYKGHKIVPYCPRCGTALSSHEVAQGYKDVKEKTAVVKFKVKGEDNLFILAWTTTPWTLPSNVALCMHPEYDYSMIECEGERFILAHELIKNHFDEGTYTVISTKKGIEYEKMEYEPLYPFYKGEEKYGYVVCDGYVTLTDGTGVVHIAPAFGEDDAKVGRRYGLPFVQMIAEDGKFIEDATGLTGIFCKDADKLILKDLKERGLLKAVLDVTHSYPFCWRCDTPLLYYAKSTWFIKVTAIRDRLLKNNASVNWIPDSIGKGRMGNFLENTVDWGLSRDRYWGTPLPVWVCEKCGKIHVVGSKAELKELGKIEGDIELHKPFVDEITFECECGGTMHRTPEVIDCWYDSGSMPFAQYHYPFENKDVFEKTFPADFISEAVDQTRGWFYTLLTISTLLFDKAPFKNCIVLGHVNDKNGVKMSKHKGNVVDPWSVLDKQGADAVRWYFYTSSMPWLPSRFSADAVSEAQRKFLGTLWNTYSFYVLYAEIDKFDPTKYNLKDCDLSVMDKWVLSKLNTLIGNVMEWLDEYKITESARAIADFTDLLSNWYIRRCRERYWGSDMTEDKKAAYMTLYTVLETLTRLCAPFVPFVSECIYRNIVKSVDKNAPVSVHLTKYPEVDESLIDSEIEKEMDTAVVAAECGRAARNAATIKNRQPLQRLILSGDGLKNMSAGMMEVIKDELNVKEVEFVADAGEFASYEVKPQLKTLGPRFGAKLGKVRAHLAENADKIATTVNSGAEYIFELDGEQVALTKEDLLIGFNNKEGFVAASDKGITAVLVTTLTDELIEEGILREIVSKIQTMRKDSGFEVTDHIVLGYSSDAEIINKVFGKFAGDLKKEVLAREIKACAEGEKCNINGYDAVLSVVKA
ncbi:MAG: isoleucine--tRNA ligase [Clostridia bacterium]|nr:isoleucine--tRNA ligase [Clostridia bacterium]